MPNAIVLDLMMPRMDGLELCRWIRARSDVPVIMLTALGEEADRIVGLELGADDYVATPFSPRQLAVRVKPGLGPTSPGVVKAATVRVPRVAIALLAAVLPLGTVLASGLVMFHMHDDVKSLMLSSTAAVASIVGALLLARWILAAFERLHASSARLAGGDLGARAP